MVVRKDMDEEDLTQRLSRIHGDDPGLLGGFSIHTGSHSSASDTMHRRKALEVRKPARLIQVAHRRMNRGDRVVHGKWAQRFVFPYSLVACCASEFSRVSKMQSRQALERIQMRFEVFFLTAFFEDDFVANVEWSLSGKSKWVHVPAQPKCSDVLSLTAFVIIDLPL